MLAIVDADVARRGGWMPIDLARACLDGGATFLQVRAKALDAAALLTLCDDVVDAAAPYRAAVIVNDRADVAMLSDAAGVHVGQDDLPPGRARALLGSSAVIGWSTHSLPHVEAATREPISYIAVGPVFGTSTKDTGYEAVGVRLVTAAVQACAGLPVVAIGGITLDTAASVWRAGATTVAVISDLLTGGNPSARVASYNRLAYGTRPDPQGAPQ